MTQCTTVLREDEFYDIRLLDPPASVRDPAGIWDPTSFRGNTVCWWSILKYNLTRSTLYHVAPRDALEEERQYAAVKICRRTKNHIWKGLQQVNDLKATQGCQNCLYSIGYKPIIISLSISGLATVSGVTERLGALGHIDTLGPNLSWALAGYHT